ncbi:hypothetical protein ACJX0J_035994 [Zea mays]
MIYIYIYIYIYMFYSVLTSIYILILRTGVFLSKRDHYTAIFLSCTSSYHKIIGKLFGLFLNTCRFRAICFMWFLQNKKGLEWRCILLVNLERYKSMLEIQNIHIVAKQNVFSECLGLGAFHHSLYKKKNENKKNK